MRLLVLFYSSSLGRKILTAAAGILLCGFLVLHLAGNLLIFSGEAAFNGYALRVESNPLIVPAELILAGLFLVHILIASWIRYKNARARPVGYSLYKDKGGRTPGSRGMTITALIILAFLIIHLKSFRFGDKSLGLYHLVVASFKNPYYALFYVVSMAALALHLSHGFQSAFQTFGINHPRYTPVIKAAGVVFAAAIGLGFAAMPIWVMFFLR